MITWVIFAPCKHCAIASFSTRFRSRENVSIRNRVRVKTLHSLGMHASFNSWSLRHSQIQPWNLDYPDAWELGWMVRIIERTEALSIWLEKPVRIFRQMEQYTSKSEKKGIPRKVLPFFPKIFHGDEPFHLNSLQDYRKFHSSLKFRH